MAACGWSHAIEGKGPPCNITAVLFSRPRTYCSIRETSTSVRFSFSLPLLSPLFSLLSFFLPSYRSVSFYTSVLRLPFSAAPALLLSLPGRTQTPSKPRCMWHFYLRRPELMYQRVCVPLSKWYIVCTYYSTMHSRSPRMGCLTRSCYKQDRLVEQIEIT